MVLISLGTQTRQLALAEERVRGGGEGGGKKGGRRRRRRERERDINNMENDFCIVYTWMRPAGLKFSHTRTLCRYILCFKKGFTCHPHSNINPESPSELMLIFMLAQDDTDKPKRMLWVCIPCINTCLKLEFAYIYQAHKWYLIKLKFLPKA